LIEECRKVVALKRRLDNEIQERVDSGCIPSDRIPITDYAVTHPEDFLEKLLPFWEPETWNRSSDIEVKDARVDPNQIVSGTYRNYSEDVTPDYLNGINQASLLNENKPIYYKVGDLPLYMAKEGKNRVKIFAEHNVEIFCQVICKPYPAPDLLLIHETYLQNGVYFVSCKDYEGGLVQVVYPEVILPLLRAYGVQDGKKLDKPKSQPIEN
jgi:hypothetical protein